MEATHSTSPKFAGPRSPVANIDLGAIPTEIALRIAEADRPVWPEAFALYQKMKTGPPMLDRKGVKRIVDWHLNTIVGKEKDGTFVRLNDGRKVLITTYSVYAHLIDLLVLANPNKGPDATVEDVKKAWEKFA
jgi:hypothetical protein